MARGARCAGSRCRDPEGEMSHLIYNEARPWDKLVWGLILIGLGVCFLLPTFGLVPSHLFRTWWPVIVIAMGTGSLLCARSPRAIGSAVSTLGIGGWMLIAANDWFELGWSRSWPLALVAAGLGLAPLRAQPAGDRLRGEHARHRGLDVDRGERLVRARLGPQLAGVGRAHG